jgi:hypothetical protein
MTVFRLRAARNSATPLLAAVLVSLCGSHVVRAETSAHSPAGLTLKSLVLSAQDIRSAYGPGGKLAAGITVTNAMEKSTSAQTGLSSAQAGLVGRQTGYIAEYIWNRTPSLKGTVVQYPAGVFSVTSNVNVYRTSSYAQNVMTLVPTIKLKKHPGVTNSLSSVGGVGDKAFLDTERTVAKNTTTSYAVSVEFVQGRYLGFVFVDSYVTKPTVSTVINLAKLIDSRVRSGG